MSQTSGIGFKRQSSTGNIPVWQRDKALLLAQGGFVLDKSNLEAGMILAPGTPLVFDEAARTAVVLPVGKIQAAASNTDTLYRVKKGNTLKKGQNLSATEGGVSSAITNVDRSNAAYDVITVGTTLGEALTAGQTVFASANAGATSADIPNGINGLLYEETTVDLTITQFVSAVIRGTVYARRVPYSAQLAAVAGLSHIIYSQSR